MFEKTLIKMRFRKIVFDLRRSKTLPATRRVDAIFEGWWSEAANVMKKNNWSPLQAVTAMVTLVATASEVSGHNDKLKLSDPALYQEFKNLYTFFVLALDRNTEIAAAFVYPNDGDPKPFL